MCYCIRSFSYSNEPPAPPLRELSLVLIQILLHFHWPSRPLGSTAALCSKNFLRCAIALQRLPHSLLFHPAMFLLLVVLCIIMFEINLVHLCTHTHTTHPTPIHWQCQLKQLFLISTQTSIIRSTTVFQNYLSLLSCFILALSHNRSAACVSVSVCLISDCVSLQALNKLIISGRLCLDFGVAVQLILVAEIIDSWASFNYDCIDLWLLVSKIEDIGCVRIPSPITT